MMKAQQFFALLGVSLLSFSSVWAQTFVDHAPASGIFDAAGTQRNPLTPREDESVELHFRVGYQFQYSSVAVYYTTDGSTPAGNIGFPSGTTQVLNSFASQIQFWRNESTGSGVVDWWKTTLPSPTRAYNQTIKYFIQAWGATTSQQTGVFTYTNKIAWPGQGSNFANHTVGYPPVHFWKEEGVTGNGYLNTMLDANGSIYDIYYPSAGTVEGVAAKNEGYVDGLDTFPPGLPLGSRGQLNVNAAFAGLRFNGKTYWMTNASGGDYTGWTQSYNENSQTITTSSRLVANGANFKVDQIDFAPYGITFPNDTGGNPNRGIHIKRMLIKNDTASTQSLGVYYYFDPALNGGDNYDNMFAEAARGAMCAYDNTFRTTSGSGEYNPTSFGNMTKDVSLYLAASMKVPSAVGGGAGTAAPDSWRDTSSDQSQGWIGQKITLAPGETKEVNIAMVGGFNRGAGNAGTYNAQIVPVLNWFQSNSMATAQSTTDTTWTNWLGQGVTIDFQDDEYDKLFKRGLLATALHLDGASGAVVAGMHNGAYMYSWPRDAVWAAVTMARAGHHPESANVYNFLRLAASRENESWGKGFFFQKYTTDGYRIWTAPQVDETAVVPWGVKFHYDCTGDTSFLNTNYLMVKDSAYASSSDSTYDSRLYYDDTFNLMHTMNLWEDQFGLFIFSNANCVRGMWDAAWIANKLGFNSDATIFNNRGNALRDGMNGRLDWNGENTDISLLGPVYPFNVLPANDARMAKVIDRINGVATDTFGNNRPLVNYTGEFTGLINRYWGDTYWNGGPWFLSTMWYGMYYLQRSDFTPGKGDINNHKYRLDRTKAFNGPIGLGAEQMAPSNSLLYPGQTDFRLQAAWPNAWESMSFYVDSIMGFLGFTPDAGTNTLRIAPRLPSSWNAMTFNNVEVGSGKFNVTAKEGLKDNSVEITNVVGSPFNYEVYIRIPAGKSPVSVRANGVNVPYTFESGPRRVKVSGALATGLNAKTKIAVVYQTYSGPFEVTKDKLPAPGDPGK